MKLIDQIREAKQAREANERLQPADIEVDAAAEIRALIAKAALMGLQKNETTPLQLFEEVWYRWFYGKSPVAK